LTCFVDTSAVLALFDADDRHHKTARRAWERLLEEHAPLVTTNYMVVELIALLRKRFGIKSVRLFQEDFMPLFKVVWIDREIHDKGLIAVLYGDRPGYSLVDCTAFEVMKKLGIRRVFTFDRHFRDQGFEAV
jgi:predicted nucleic acid-binding protein